MPPRSGTGRRRVVPPRRSPSQARWRRHRRLSAVAPPGSRTAADTTGAPRPGSWPPMALPAPTAAARLDHLVSLRSQVARVVEGDVDVLDPRRVESAVQLVPDQVAQHAPADPAIRRTTSTGGGEHAKQPRLAADKPLQRGRGGWQLRTETHWRSPSRRLPGEATAPPPGSDVQPVGTWLPRALASLRDVRLIRA